MTNTVYFRSFEEEDAPYIYEWTNDDDLKSLSVGLNRRICKDEALDWVKYRMRHNPYEVWWAICAKDTDKIIGYLYLTHIHYINSSAEFGGLVIGDSNYRDGSAWIESYIFIFNYVFERLNINRLYGTYLETHPATKSMADAVYFKQEGIMRQSVFKNGKYNNEIIASLLAEEYFEHKKKGDYSYNSVLHRLVKGLKINKK